MPAELRSRFWENTMNEANVTAKSRQNRKKTGLNFTNPPILEFVSTLLKDNVFP